MFKQWRQGERKIMEIFRMAEFSLIVSLGAEDESTRNQ
jgi:hypothetical protein